jgi:hypothetical protein
VLGIYRYFSNPKLREETVRSACLIAANCLRPTIEGESSGEAATLKQVKFGVCVALRRVIAYPPKFAQFGAIISSSVEKEN